MDNKGFMRWRLAGVPGLASKHREFGRQVTVRQRSHIPGETTMAAGDAGFTLLELLVVIAILGLLAALVGPRLFNVLTGAKNKVAAQQIEQIGGLLGEYKLDVGSYPTTEQGLAALVTKPNDVETWSGPYIKNSGVPKDPWNHPWSYANPSTRQGVDYDLCSGGANGVPAQPGQEGAICNQ
jgi:general secretion pathway protein G